MPPSETKVAVQRAARGFEAVVNGHDADRQHDRFSAELIGTVGTRTRLRLELAEGETNVVELLWRDYDGTWLIHDCRVFSLIPGI